MINTQNANDGDDNERDGVKVTVTMRTTSKDDDNDDDDDEKKSASHDVGRIRTLVSSVQVFNELWRQREESVQQGDPSLSFAAPTKLRCGCYAREKNRETEYINIGKWDDGKVCESADLQTKSNDKSMMSWGAALVESPSQNRNADDDVDDVWLLRWYIIAQLVGDN